MDAAYMEAMNKASETVYKELLDMADELQNKATECRLQAAINKKIAVKLYELIHKNPGEALYDVFGSFSGNKDAFAIYENERDYEDGEGNRLNYEDFEKELVNGRALDNPLGYLEKLTEYTFYVIPDTDMVFEIDGSLQRLTANTAMHVYSSLPLEYKEKFTEHYKSKRLLEEAHS